MIQSYGPVSVEMYGRAGTLTYSEGEHLLRIDLEMSGVPQFLLLALTTPDEFQTWTVPAGEPIPAPRQREIVLAIRRWEVEQRCPISL
jgi:hypothetical protein